MLLFVVLNSINYWVQLVIYIYIYIYIFRKRIKTQEILEYVTFIPVALVTVCKETWVSKYSKSHDLMFIHYKCFQHFYYQ